jgi:hypothetical protein
MIERRFTFVGRRVVVAEILAYAAGVSAPRLLAVRAAGETLNALARETQLWREAREFLGLVVERPTDEGFLQSEWDRCTAVVAATSPAAIVVSDREPGDPCTETWEAGEAWSPVVTVDVDPESGTHRAVSVRYAARPVAADEIDAERTAALGLLQARFRTARDLGVDVAIGGEAVRFETTPQAQSEIRSLRDYLAAQPPATTQKIRTRAGRSFVVNRAVAEAMLTAVEDRVSAVWANDATIGAALDAAETITAIRAVDLDAGWPT